MKRSYFLKKPFMVARLTRIFAKAIDIFIVLLLSFFLFPLGIVFGIIYFVFSDSIQNGQSVGKKFMGFAVISLEDGKPCSVKQSLIRNLPFIIPLSLCVIPIGGLLIGILLGLIMVLMELYFLYKLDSGHRLGDVMADTSVMANDGTSEAIKRRKSSWFEGTNQTSA